MTVRAGDLRLEKTREKERDVHKVRRKSKQVRYTHDVSIHGVIKRKLRLYAQIRSRVDHRPQTRARADGRSSRPGCPREPCSGEDVS